MTLLGGSIGPMKFDYDVIDLGLSDYKKTLKLQGQYHKGVLSGQKPVVLFVEHPSVITLGPRASIEQDLVVSESSLKENGIEVFHTDRGGEATLHSPGQLVIYPILPIKLWGLKLRDYVQLLLSTTSKTFFEYGAPADIQTNNPGVYVEGLKVAFVGLRVERGVVRHGVSINLTNDLSLFNKIKPCGEDIVKVNSLSNILEAPVVLSEFSSLWSSLFNEGLNCY